jgi:hypothetical protein
MSWVLLTRSRRLHCCGAVLGVVLSAPIATKASQMELARKQLSGTLLEKGSRPCFPDVA